VSPSRPLPQWRCVVRRHEVAGREVAALSVVLPALSEDHAQRLAVQEAHRRAEVPPLRSLAEQSLPFVSAERRT
jgi:hypothetical protein